MEKLKTLILTKTEFWVKLAWILLFLMFFVLCFVFTGTLGAQTTVTIGSGTNSQTHPFNCFYGYGRSATIYTSSEIGTTGTITHLQWEVGTSRTTSIPIKIYIKETSSSSMSTDTWSNLTSGATLVYNSTVQFNSTGWFQIDITDFDYSTNNLMVLCEANYGGAGTSNYPQFKYHTGTHLYLQADNSAPAGNGTTNTNRPNIKITIVECSMVGGTATANDNTINVGENTSISCSGHTSSGSNLNWEQSADGSTGWANVTGGSGSTTATYTTPNLSETTYYRLKVTQTPDTDCFDYSSTASVTVACGVSGGTASATDSDIYFGESTDVSCSGYTSSGTSLQWQESANGTTGWADVTGGTGATSSTYSTAFLGQTTYFRLVVNDGVCTSFSNAVCVSTSCIVIAGGTATAADASIAMGGTTVITCSGYTSGATQFQWQQSADGSSDWSNVTGGSGANADTYTTGPLWVRTYYRVEVGDGFCDEYSSVDDVQTTLSNDECIDAVLLEVGDACSFSTFNNTGATVPAVNPNPGCGGGTRKDVWFKFVVPEGGRVIIETEAFIGSTLTDGVMAVYSGTCGTLNLVACNDDKVYPGQPMPYLDISGLTEDAVYYIRFWEYAGTKFGNFNICISKPVPAAPDECANAMELTVSDVCVYVSFDNTGCTAGSGVADPSCGSSSNYNDVWFKFIVPESGAVRISTEEVTGSDLTDCALSVYSGACGSLTEIGCNDDYVTGHYEMPLLDLVGLTENDVIYIRFWDKTGTKTIDEGVCKICVHEMQASLSCVSTTVPEDLCGDAPLITSLNGYCGNTSSSYTPETPGNIQDLFCGSIENNSWLTFTASEATVQLNVYVSDCYSSSNPWPYPTSGVQMQVYGTNNCSTFTSYSDCWFPAAPRDGFITASGLTPGNTYYLMIDGVYGDDCDYKIGAAEGTVLLPVEFTSASAVCKGDLVEISWQTASEKNCDYFSVEKSFDAVSFVPIMSVPGAGNYAGQSDYYYDDYDFSEVRTYYRIKQTDFDGKFSYSKLFTVNCFEYKKSDISIYPNPFNKSFCVDFASCKKQPIKIEICSLSGTLLLSRNVESNENNQECFSLDETFAPGYFLLKIFFDDDIQVLKLVKI